jgi:hypothetical protein
MNIDSLAQQLFDILNPLYALLFITHHAQGTRTAHGLVFQLYTQQRRTYMNFFLS